jgi:membrane-bound lytic murein transglycosylase D
MSRSLLATALALTLGACATTPGQQSAQAGASARRPAAAQPAAVDALYSELTQTGADYSAGLDSYRRGEMEAARQKFSAARENWRMLAARCVKLAGCEVERVLAQQDAALAASASELLADNDGEPSAETDPAEKTVEPGEESPITADLPEAARAARLLRGKDLGEIIQLNAPTKAALEDWLTWQRPNLIEAYENYQYLRAAMWPAYEKAGLPEALLFGFLATESGGKVHAYSRAGAAGPLQFMYSTGARYGLGNDNGFDMRFDPAASARANVAYLNDELRSLNNNLELTLAAYNGGEGRIDRLAGGGSRSFWDPPLYYALPPETRDYVPVVLAAAYLFLHPERYNLKFPQIDARTSTVSLQAPISLNELTLCLGQEGTSARGWFRQLRNLNPRYEPNDPIAAGTALVLPTVAAPAYDRNCSDGPMLAMSADLHSAHPPQTPKNATNRLAIKPRQGGKAARGNKAYVVRKGETLGGIAKKFGCKDVRNIAAANGLRAPHYAIHAGQQLTVPDCQVVTAAR